MLLAILQSSDMNNHQIKIIQRNKKVSANVSTACGLPNEFHGNVKASTKHASMKRVSVKLCELPNHIFVTYSDSSLITPVKFSAGYRRTKAAWQSLCATAQDAGTSCEELTCVYTGFIKVSSFIVETQPKHPTAFVLMLSRREGKLHRHILNKHNVVKFLLWLASF